MHTVYVQPKLNFRLKLIVFLHALFGSTPRGGNDRPSGGGAELRQGLGQ